MQKQKTQQKPYPDFPLFYHRTGQWAKKVRGRTHYFGVDPDAALAKWLEQRDDLMAGRPPRTGVAGCSVRDLVNRFLSSKKLLLESGELSPRTWNDYYHTCERLVDLLGKNTPVECLTGADLEQLRAKLAKTRGPVSLGNEIQRVRTVLKYAWDEGLIEKPVRVGATFKKPSLKTMRKARHAAGVKMFEAADLRKIIEAAPVPFKAMVMLGINAGLGNTDVAGLTLAAVDLERGWLDYPREKTGIGRRCKLWPETVEAIRETIAERPEPEAGMDAGLVFLTRSRNAWVRVKEREGKNALPIDSIQKEFRKLLAAAGVKHAGFYALRHTFRTVADGAGDQVAADFVMGHVQNSMSAAYRERIDDARLEAVVRVVREWLWPVAASTMLAKREDSAS